MKGYDSDKIFNFLNYLILSVICFLMLYPIYFVIIASFSNPYDVANGRVYFFLKGFSLDAYINVFRNKEIWTGYRNTIFYTVFGTLYNLVLTIPAAYVLSKKNLPGRSILSWYFFITMYFSGGMIPHFILINQLKLYNTPWVLIIGSGVSCYNLIVTRQYFSTSISESLYESAYIDGASDFKSFFTIALPLSLPIIAVMALFYGVAKWNDYYGALVFVRNRDYWPLQLILRNILILNQTMFSDSTSISDDMLELAVKQSLMAEAMKYSLIFIASAPLLIAYPFVQKFFVKGVMIGAVKG